MELNHYCQCWVFSPIKETFSIIYPLIILTHRNHPGAIQEVQDPSPLVTSCLQTLHQAMPRVPKSRPSTWCWFSLENSLKQLRNGTREHFPKAMQGSRVINLITFIKIVQRGKKIKTAKPNELENREWTELLIQGFNTFLFMNQTRFNCFKAQMLDACVRNLWSNNESQLLLVATALELLIRISYTIRNLLCFQFIPFRGLQVLPS